MSEEIDMGESDVPMVCPKCGGKMVQGNLTIPMERMSTRTMDQLNPGFSRGGLPPMMEDYSTEPHWKEKTGEKTGFIFKRDEVKQMKIIGYRCKLCNFIELYAEP